VALAVHESNVVFILLPAAVRWGTGQSIGWRHQLRELVLSGTVLGAYGLLAIGLRHAASQSGTQYDGATILLDAREIVFALGVYSLAAIPGVEFGLNRMAVDGPTIGYGPSQVIARVWSNAGATDWIVAAITGLALWALLKALERDEAQSRPGNTRIVVPLGYALFAPNLLLALTPKYQGWAHQRMWPYYYSWMSYLAIVLLLALGAVRLQRALPVGRVRIAGRLALAVLAGAITLGIRATSREALAQLRQHPFSHTADAPERGPVHPAGQ
jgi:hypothetical protein